MANDNKLAVSENEMVKAGYEHMRIKDVVCLDRHFGFVIKAIEATRGNDTRHTTGHVLSLLCRGCYDPDFFIVVQLLDREPVAFLALYVGTDLFDERFASAWMLYIKPEGNYGLLDAYTKVWLRAQGVGRLSALNDNFTKHKRRWLTKKGFKLQDELWTKEI